MTLSVGFAGMTHLGLVYSAATASKNLNVICYDNNPTLIGNINSGLIPVMEEGLCELINENGTRQKFTHELKSLANCDVVYISADVPTDHAGASDLTGIKLLIKDVISVLSPDSVLVILCQVPPGFTRSIDFCLEKVFYQVETLVFGTALERALNPERFIVGSLKPEKQLCFPLNSILKTFDAPILNMRYESAELAKIAINMCLVSSISVANTLAEICEGIGADWNEIVPALKLDRRIGKNSYLKPGLGIAGGNLERDISTVISLSEEYDTDACVVRAWRENNLHRKEWAVRIFNSLKTKLGVGDIVAVWGLAYKENTHSIKNSPSIFTIMQLENTKINIHDPVVSDDVIQFLDKERYQCPLDALKDAKVLAILTPWPEYGKIEISKIAEKMKGNIIIDPYRVLDPHEVRAFGLVIYTLGMPPLDKF